MTAAKLRVRVGSTVIAGEGDQDWLSAQLDKILETINKNPDLTRVVDKRTNGDGGDNASSTIPAQGMKKPLATFLGEHSATVNQVRKFLATAEWLSQKGKDRLETADVVKALKDANQTRLGNPSDCLAKNIGKGHCDRDGDKFFVTDEGRTALNKNSGDAKEDKA